MKKQGGSIVSKIYCSSYEQVFMVRSRPNVVYGGGFVVLDSNQTEVFRVEGCGTLGKRADLLLRDSHGDALLLIRRKDGFVEALSLHKHWKGYSLIDQKLVFTLKEPPPKLLHHVPNIRISTQTGISCASFFNCKYDFEIKGYFQDRDCAIIDSDANVIAQVGIKKEVESKDVYEVVVKADVDQAFVFGIIAVLDYVFDGSTKC
ncbi:protein LURP-one-related 6-like [Impatiens glandulifera]|uniref:protein LURP-one-related 6-like n=1 Tax=Impatiens glandulifera TaxID=253017 RepID=UPI001FB12149|nr:protein LURP-one-related 6-like [Impatiens glandulifera]